MNREQCRRCAYWKNIYSRSNGKCCHYLLETRHMRERDGDRCLSRRTRSQTDKEAKGVHEAWNG